MEHGILSAVSRERAWCAAPSRRGACDGLRRTPRFVCALAFATAFGCLSAGSPETQEPSIQLWYYHHTYLSNDDALRTSKALVDRAAAAGYTGMCLWDSNVNVLGNDFASYETEGRIGELLRYAAQKHLKTMVGPGLFGYSNEVLQTNPNWAEAQRVVGTEFQVDRPGKQLTLHNSFPGLANAGFEDGKTAWFDTGDAGIGVNTVAHSGKASAVIVDAPGNARLRQKFPLTPWRQYHLRVFYKSSNFKGQAMIEVLDKSNFDKGRVNAYFPASGSHDWTQADYTFNSEDSTEGYLYLGVWGGSSGILWFDDIQIEETALVYLVRRSGAPLKIYDPHDPSKVYREGADYNYVSDPHVETTRTPFNDSYHAPAPITLPKGTRLTAGGTVAVDSYSAFPIPGALGVAMCMSEPVVYKWIAQNARAIKKVLPADGSVCLGYDEIRQMNSCAKCRAKNMSAGQLLAWSMGQSLQAYQTIMPETPMYTWNDMFDPYHNARDHYYYVEGDIAGSWKGVPRNVIIMNWNLGHLKESLTWFSGGDGRQPIPHRQVIAGYYDSHNGAAAAQQELSGAIGIPGIQGLMYTTWEDDYSQLESFAATARAHWGEYTASVPKAGLNYRR